MRFKNSRSRKIGKWRSAGVALFNNVHAMEHHCRAKLQPRLGRSLALPRTTRQPRLGRSLALPRTTRQPRLERSARLSSPKSSPYPASCDDRSPNRRDNCCCFILTRLSNSHIRDSVFFLVTSQQFPGADADRADWRLASVASIIFLLPRTICLHPYPSLRL